MTLRQAQRAADRAWASYASAPSPATRSQVDAATANLVAAQNAAWDGTEWRGSPDTQPK